MGLAQIQKSGKIEYYDVELYPTHLNKKGGLLFNPAQNGEMCSSVEPRVGHRTGLCVKTDGLGMAQFFEGECRISPKTLVPITCQSTDNPLTEAFPLQDGYINVVEADADGNGFDELYIKKRNDNMEDSYFAADLTPPEVPHTKWLGIKEMSIPYDLDLFTNDGCGGSDLLFDDKPLKAMVYGGALYIYDEDDGIRYLMTGGSMYAWHYYGGWNSHLTRRELVRGGSELRNNYTEILECAITGSDQSMMIHSALWNARRATVGRGEEKGSFKITPMQIRFRHVGIDYYFSAKLENPKWQEGAHEFRIDVEPDGALSEKKHYVLNRAGRVYSSYINGGPEFCAGQEVDNFDVKVDPLIFAGLEAICTGNGISSAERKTIKEAMVYLKKGTPVLNTGAIDAAREVYLASREREEIR